MLAILAMEKLAEVATGQTRTRLLAMAATCQAHASRLLGRLAALGGAPLPVPPDDIDLPDPPSAAMRQEAARAQFAAERYSTMANLARKAVEPAAAWVCELNRQEELDRARELLELATACEQQGDASFLAPPG
ncbi:MAG: hypothetical protein ACK4N5_11255 [Myxococcales bacterium]